MQIRPDMPARRARGGELATGLHRFCIHVPARLKLNTKTLYTIFFDKQTAERRDGKKLISFSRWSTEQSQTFECLHTTRLYRACHAIFSHKMFQNLLRLLHCTPVRHYHIVRHDIARDRNVLRVAKLFSLCRQKILSRFLENWSLNGTKLKIKPLKYLKFQAALL